LFSISAAKLAQHAAKAYVWVIETNIYQDPNAVEFTREDWKKLNQRFVQTQLKKAEPEVQEIWSGVSETAGRSGKWEKQHQILTAWVIDPKCGDTFMGHVRSLTLTEKMTSEEQWVSKKKILEDYDESEVEEMLQNGSLEYRKNPLNPKRFQYKKIEIKRAKQMSSEKAMSVRGKKTIDDDNTWGRLSKAFDNVNLDSKILKGSSKKAFSILGVADAEEDESEDDENAKKKPIKGPKGPKPDGSETKDKNYAEMDLAQLHKEARSLISSVTKSIVDGKQNISAFKQCAFGTAAKVKEASSAVAACEKSLKLLHDLVLNSSGTEKKTRQALTLAAAAHKDLKAVIANMKKCLKMDTGSVKGD
jgi:hypothetical protein